MMELLTYAINQIRKGNKNEGVRLEHREHGEVGVQTVVFDKLQSVVVRSLSQEGVSIPDTPDSGSLRVTYLMKEDGDVAIKKTRGGKVMEEVNLSIGSVKNLNKIHRNIDNNV